MLDSGSSGLGSSPGLDNALCFCARYYSQTHEASLRPSVSTGNGEFNVVKTLRCTSIPSRERRNALGRFMLQMGPLQLGSRDHNFPKNLLYYGL